MDWLRKAAHHVEEIEILLIANHHLTRVQLDAMWTYVGHKGEKASILKNLIEEHSGEGTAIDIDTRLRVGRAIGKNEEEVAAAMMSQIKELTHRVIYGDPNEVPDFMGLNTAYVESTNLTSRQMNGRMVRKTLSFSKEEEMLQASCALEDTIYNLMRPVKTSRIEVNNDQRRWQSRTPAMAAGLTDHIWTIEEIMMTVVVPEENNT